MKERYFFLLFLPLFMSVSCGDGDGQRGHATVTVYNQSDSVVTDIVLWCAGWSDDTRPTLSELKQGESHKFNVELWDKNPRGGGGGDNIQYSINGEQFGVEYEEGKLWREYISEPGGCYYSPHYLKDGAKASFYIKNEGYGLTIKGGGYWIAPEGPPDLSR